MSYIKVELTIKDGEKEIDPKMEELKRQLNTEDGGN